MMTSTPEPPPEDVARGLAELEDLANAAPAPAAPEPADDAEPADLELYEPQPLVLPSGDTRRVRALAAEVAEAHRLAALQADETPLELDTPRVRRRRRAAYEAARLHALAQDPTMRAWSAARMRRLLVTVAMVALALALAWSTAGVQKFAAEGAAPWSPGWVFAWLVEPFLSLALLVVVGARAYLGSIGQPATDRTLSRIEHLFLGVTLGMNAWPYLPWVAAKFSFSTLVLHMLGPVVAVAIVTALPIILAAFAGLDHGPIRTPLRAQPRPSAPPPSDQRWSTPEERGRGRSSDAHRARLHQLIAEGSLPAQPSARAIQNALRCREDLSRILRDELRGGGA